MSPPRELDLAHVQRLLATRGLTAKLQHHHSCASTNDLAKQALAAGGGESLVVIAEHQTAGRGRFERRWESAPGLNLLFSIGVRWPRSGFTPTWLTPAAAVAVRGAIESLLGLPLAIKWPNDIVIPEGDRALKVAGILSDLIGQGDEWAAAVGIGINVNQVWPESAQGSERPRSSLAMALGRPLEREPLLAGVIAAFRERVAGLVRGDTDAIIREARANLWGLGHPALISLPDREWTAVPRGVDEQFRLIVESPDGATEIISAGEVMFGEGAVA